MATPAAAMYNTNDIDFDGLSALLGGAPLFDVNPYYLTAPAEQFLLSGPDQDDANLVRAILALWSGDIRRARGHLDAIATEKAIETWSLAHWAVRTLIEKYRDEPILPTYGINNADTPQLLAMISLVEAGGTYGKCRKMQRRMPESISEEQKLAVSFLLATPLITSQLYSMAICVSNINYPAFRNDSADFKKSCDAAVERFQNALDIYFIDNARRIGCRSATKYSDYVRVAVEACRNGKMNSVEVEDLLMRYSQDGLTKARLLMAWADSLVSPQWSSPVLLNMCPIVRMTPYDCRVLNDALEDNIVLHENALARELYARARKCFEDVKCRYGLASVILRQACFLHWSIVDKRSPSTSSTFGRARALLEEAYELFDGNFVWQTLVRVHCVVLDLFDARRTRALATAHELHNLALDLENMQLTRLLASLMLRLGRRQAIVFARHDLAMDFWQCATIFGRGYGCNLPAFIALDWQTSVFHDHENHIDAFVSLKLNHSAFLELWADLGAQPSSGADIARRVQANILSIYRHRGSQILWKNEAASALDTWRREMDQLAASIDHRPIVPAEDSLGRHGRDAAEFLSVEAQYFDLMDVGHVNGAISLLKEYVAVKSREYKQSNFIDRALYMLGDYASLQAKVEVDLAEVVGLETQRRLGAGEPWARSTSSTEFRMLSWADARLAVSPRAKAWARAAEILAHLEEQVPDYLDPDSYGNDGGRRAGWAGLILEQNPHTNLLRSLQLLLQSRQMNIEMQQGICDVELQRAALEIPSTLRVYQALARVCLKYSQQGKHPADAMFDPLRLPRLASFDAMSLLFTEEMKAASTKGELLKSKNHADGDEDTRRHQLARILGSLPRKSASEEAEYLALADAVRSPHDGDVARRSIWEQSAAAQYLIFESTVKQDLDCIPQTTVLIIINFTEQGKVFYGLTTGRIEVCGYDEGCDRDKIRRSCAVIKRKITDGADGRQAWELGYADVREEMDYIASELLAPFRALIEAKEHVAFSVFDRLSGFPHAILPFNGRPLFLSKSISVTPSLAVFAILQRKQAVLKRSRLSLVTRPATAHEWRRTRSQNLENLPMTAIEALAICGLSPNPRTRPTASSTLTRDGLVSLFDGSDIVHIGTHGRFDKRSPWLSDLVLEKPLRVLDMASVRTRCGLVVLAACNSGLGRASYVEEAVGFAQALLSGVANALLGSVWNVGDTGTMLLMVYFYAELWACAQGTRLAEVWRRALVRMYECDTREKVKVQLEAIKGYVQIAKQRGVDADALIRDPESYLDIGEEDNAQWQSSEPLFTRGVAHPFYWASFSLIGNGAMEVWD